MEERLFNSIKTRGIHKPTHITTPAEAVTYANSAGNRGNGTRDKGATKLTPPAAAQLQTLKSETSDLLTF